VGCIGAFRHSEAVEDEAGIAVRLAHRMRHAADAFGLDRADGETAEPGDVLGLMASGDTAAVLVVDIGVDGVTSVASRCQVPASSNTVPQGVVRIPTPTP
jgi:hypothetical protein